MIGVLDLLLLLLLLGRQHTMRTSTTSSSSSKHQLISIAGLSLERCHAQLDIA
jgi:hypothetical protein